VLDGKTNPRRLTGVQTWGPSASMTSTNQRVYSAGDILLVDLDPTRGSEQAGIRPALVISSATMHEVSNRIIVCPITKNLAPWPTKIALPQACKTKGMVLADQVRTIDIAHRMLRIIEIAPDE